MITIPQIKAAGYAISKRLQGYHLLLNPETCPQTQVNMIKCSKDICCTHMDDISHYTKLSRTFNNNGYTHVEQELIATHYICPDTLEKTGKKSIIYREYSNNSSRSTHLSKDDLTYEEDVTRPEVKIGLFDYLRRSNKPNESYTRSNNFITILLRNLFNGQ